MKKPRIVIITVVITLVVVFVVGGVINSKTRASSNAVMVRVEKVQRGDLIEFVSAPGEIEPRSKVEISAKVSARIIELPFEEGDMVTRGNPNANPSIPPSVLIQLDDKDLESQLRSAEAGYAAQAAQLEVEKARVASQKATLEGLAATLKQAERDLQRQKGLLQSKDISQSTFDQTQLKFDELKSQYDASSHSLEAAELNLTVLQYNLEAAAARVTQAKEALSYTTITSPIDGVVTRINAEVGEVVVYGTMNNPGTVIMEVADLSTMLLVAQVDEADVGKLEVGQKAIVQVDAFPNHEFEGTVDSIALKHDLSSSRTKFFRTEILLKPTEEKLYSGLTAHVDIETRKHTDVLKVPTQAVMGRSVDSLPLEIRENSPLVDTAKTFATVVFRFIDGKAVLTPVEIDQSDLTHTIITAGITEGDKIVVGPYKELEKLRHDQPLRDERETEDKKTDSAETKADTNDVNDGEKN